MEQFSVKERKERGVVMFLPHALVEREDVTFCDPIWGPMHDACTGSWLSQSEMGRCYLQI